jgi:glyoxylase-like metal-dependent hydrolase (beta-lactamase superfamily II)
MRTWTTSGGIRIIRILSGRSNVFLVTNGTKNILVDTGCGFEWRLLKLRLNKLTVYHLDCLILTHSHFDHAGNANRIWKAFKTPVIIHEKEAQYLASGKSPVPEGTFAWSKMMVKMLSGIGSSIGRYRSCRNDILAESVYDLNDFGFNAYIIHTPGHTAGSVSVIIDNEIAIVGDTMFGIFPGSAFPPFAEDPKQLINSWGSLLDTGCSLFLPSHGSPNTRVMVQKDYHRRR